MIIKIRECKSKGIQYTIRSACLNDAKELSSLRVQLDGETENFDREKGEAFIDTSGFEEMIRKDTESERHLFLVAVIGSRIVGFSRCAGYDLARFIHKVEFGVGVLKEYWGYGIGRNLLRASISWADANGIKKMSLSVIETNDRAIRLYQDYGFEIEGILKKDRILADGNYNNTLIMGRFNEN